MTIREGRSIVERELGEAILRNARTRPGRACDRMLSGAERRTQLSWPAGRVHGMLDDATSVRSPARESRPGIRVDRPPSPTQVAAPVMRSRCPCTECQPDQPRVAQLAFRRPIRHFAVGLFAAYLDQLGRLSRSQALQGCNGG